MSIRGTLVGGSRAFVGDVLRDVSGLVRNLFSSVLEILVMALEIREGIFKDSVIDQG